MLSVALLFSCGASADKPPDLSSLLVSCYRAGALATYGIYQWDAAAEDFKLVFKGGRHPTWSRDHSYWICHRNGHVWVQDRTGKNRLVPQQVVGKMRRFAQPMGRDGRYLLRMVTDVGGGPSWIEVFDTQRLLSVPERELGRPLVCVYPPFWAPGKDVDEIEDPLWDRVRSDVDPDREGFSANWGVTDIATSPDDLTVALVLQTWHEGVGLLTSRIYLWDWEHDTVSQAVTPEDGRLEVNPHFMGGSRLLAFDTIDVADGRRRSHLLDRPSGKVQELQMMPGANAPGPCSTWVLAVSPDGTKLVLGTGPKQQWTHPGGLAVVSVRGEVTKIPSSPLCVWDVAWSPDSTHLAFVGSQDDPEGRGYDTRGLRMLGLWEMASGKDTSVYATFSDDMRHDDPLTPYELAW